MNDIPLDLIQRNLAIVWNFYDYPLSGLIKIDRFYFIFNCHKVAEPIEIGLDEDGDPDFDMTEPKYTLKRIGSIQAAYHITRYSLFKFCVYNKHMGCLDGPKQPSLTKFARKMANKKSDTVHSFLFGMYFPVGMQTNPII